MNIKQANYNIYFAQYQIVKYNKNNELFQYAVM